MSIDDLKKILSNDYFGMIIEYIRKDKLLLEKFRNDLIVIIDDKYGVLYFPYQKATLPFERENEYAYIPKVFSLLDTTNLDKMGVARVQNVPQLGLRGQGVLLGFVDTGIDYTNSCFKNSDGTTRILSIWDQTVENLESTENIFYYGKEYNKDKINEALKSDNPLSVVPSTDEIGHGTMLAGIAGGTREDGKDFQGVVPLSEFVVVKLRQIKQRLREYLLVPNNVPCFDQADIMFGIKYLVNVAGRVKRPIAICFGMGTNQGGHEGTDILTEFISYTGKNIGVSFIVAAGNEGNSKSHYYGIVDPAKGYNDVELNIGPNENSFAMEIWGYAPSTYAIDILSPSGQYIPKIISKLGESRKINFLFENTTMYVDSLLIEAQSGSPLILVRFINPAKGIWKFRVYARGNENLNFHVWLPIRGFITEGTFFVNSNPDTTITAPGNGRFVTTITAYNAANNAIFINASRGYTKNNIVKPDMAAPGVDVLAPKPGNQYTRVSGTSVAAAHTTGLAAMVLEWGIVKENFLTLNSMQVEKFLLRGVETEASIQYPNNVWGYGSVNIFNTFLSLSMSIS